MEELYNRGKILNESILTIDHIYHHYQIKLEEENNSSEYSIDVLHMVNEKEKIKIKNIYNQYNQYIIDCFKVFMELNCDLSLINNLKKDIECNKSECEHWLYGELGELVDGNVSLYVKRSNELVDSILNYLQYFLS